MLVVVTLPTPIREGGRGGILLAERMKWKSLPLIPAKSRAEILPEVPAHVVIAVGISMLLSQHQNPLTGNQVNHRSPATISEILASAIAKFALSFILKHPKANRQLK